MRETLEGLLQRARNDDRRAELEDQLAVPAFPLELLYLWLAYGRIRRRKAGNGFGASPVEWPDIDAFVRLSGRHLAPWEIEVIEDIDDLFLLEMSKVDKEINAEPR